MTKIYVPGATGHVPSKGPDCWKGLLADPERHWKTGYSARTLAHCWEDSDGFPPEIDEILRQSRSLRDMEPLRIFPEWKVSLPGGGRPSQNDVWMLAKASGKRVSMTIEGKVEESFGKIVKDWKKNASPGKEERLDCLAQCLGLVADSLDNIRYQLIHRTASAVIEAKRFNASDAVMLVHSFSDENKGFSDYRRFVRLFDATAAPAPDKLVSVRARNGFPLHLGWVRGNSRYLQC